MKKYIFGALAAAAAILLCVYVYINKPHRSIRNADAPLVSADSLFQAFVADEAAANARYLNQVVTVKGKVNSVETNTEGKMVVVLDAGDLMFGVNCTLAEPAQLTVGQEVSIKGICTGYLADVVITQAVIENNEK